MQATRPLNRRFAIVLALASMWLLSSIGFIIVFRLEDCWFLGLRGYDLNTLGQIGGFFMIWTSGQIHGASFAGMIIGSSDFRHPLRTTFYTMATYELLMSVVRAFRWPWGAYHDLDQSIPILAYLISVLSLIGFSVFFCWFMPRFHAFFQKHFAH